MKRKGKWDGKVKGTQGLSRLSRHRMRYHKAVSIKPGAKPEPAWPVSKLTKPEKDQFARFFSSMIREVRTLTSAQSYAHSIQNFGLVCDHPKPFLSRFSGAVKCTSCGKHRPPGSEQWDTKRP